MSQFKKVRVLCSDDADTTEEREPNINRRNVEPETLKKPIGKYGKIVSNGGGQDESCLIGAKADSNSNKSNNREDHIKASAVPAMSADSICKECSKRVYELERVTADLNVYHKACFKCTHCKRLLSLSTYSSANGVPFCKPHFLELFKTKGNYEDWQLENSAQPANEIESASDTNDDAVKVQAPKINLPEVKNMKMLFETSNPHQQELAKSGIYSSMENLSGKKQSKWDKPERPVPPPVNRPIEEENPTEVDQSDEINPPVDITKNLVAKFRVYEQGTQSPAVVRKPIRPMTPPRELEREFSENPDMSRTRGEVVVSCLDKVESAEELPPPETTKNLLARFKSMESVSGGFSARRTSSFAELERTELAHVESGVYENEPASNPDVARESDGGSEMELPEEGITRSLVAQWRAAESSGFAAVCTPVRRMSRSPSYTSLHRPSPAPTAPAATAPAATPVATSATLREGLPADTTGASPLDVQAAAWPIEGEKEPVRAGVDEMEVETLPPPNITRNLLAMFQGLGGGGDTASSEPAANKQFKWDVKEAKPVNYRGLVSGSLADKNSETLGYTMSDEVVD